MEPDPHRIAQERSIAIHGVVADRLRAQPELLEVARRRVDGWLEDGSVAPYYAKAWRQVLTCDIEQVSRFIVDPGERARALRQVTPFAGFVDSATRWQVWRQVYDGAPAAPARHRGEPMTREQLEHIIRASAAIADDHEIVVIGSQAILGQHPNAPAELLVSTEADVFPRNFPERADLIDGAIGEVSSFHTTYGYYAHGVGPKTALLPDGWEERLVAVEGPGTKGATGLCLEPHDLVSSKYVAGRDQDREFVRVAVQHRLVVQATLLDRLAATPLDPARRAALDRQVLADFQR